MKDVSGVLVEVGWLLRLMRISKQVVQVCKWASEIEGEKIQSILCDSRSGLYKIFISVTMRVYRDSDEQKSGL